MLSLFRRIRKSFISSGAIRKYLLYAIGEILLVMVGILLALQVNNWNEQSKTNTNELRLLQGLYNSIENEIVQWNFILNNNYKGDSSYQTIVKFLDNELPYNPSLDRAFNEAMRQWYHELNKTAFETAQGYGLNFIENQTTVDHLSDMYERWHNIYIKTNKNSDAFYYAVAAPYLFDIFEKGTGKTGSELAPINPQLLIEDRKFRSILEQQGINRKALIRWQELILEDMHESMELLALEMKRY